MVSSCFIGRDRRFATRLRALRAFSFPVSVLPVLVATAAVRSVAQWDWSILVASVVGVMALHAAGNLLNDYFDFRSGVDRKLDDDDGRPGRFLVRGEMVPREVLAEALVCLLLAAPAAIYLVWRCGAGLIWFGMAGCVGLYAYTGPPFRLKYRALGELLIFLVFGPFLMLGAAYAQTGNIESRALLLAVPVGFVTAAILVGNNIRDHEEDAVAGITTLPSLIGIRMAGILYAALVAGSTLYLFGLTIAGAAPRVLALTPVLLALIAGPMMSVWRGERIADIDVRTARFETVLLLFLFVVLTASGGGGMAR